MNSIPNIPNLKGRDFLTLADYTPAELTYLLRKAQELKARPLAYRPLVGKHLALLFEKPSTRTRVSFEVGMRQLGGDTVVLTGDQTQLGRGESIADTAKVLSRYVDGIMIRTFAQEMLVEMAQCAAVPVINGLTDLLHPCQALADFLTIWEKKQSLSGLKLAYFGDGNNMAHSLMLGGAIMGLEVVVATPTEYQPNPKITAEAMQLADEYGGKIRLTTDAADAAEDADVLYTDAWISMGQKESAARKKAVLSPYQINQTLLGRAKLDCLVLHCLPAHYGEEVTLEVARSANAVFFDQAENRLHAQKAILAELLS